jgi:hypothetical protein
MGELPGEPPANANRRRGELLSPAGDVLANIWVVDEGDVDELRTLRPVHDHADLATVGCVFVSNGEPWLIAGVSKDRWACRQAPPASKAGDA